jgi:hypothetical protein
MVDLGRAHVDRRAAKINGVQPAADPSASLDDYALDPAQCQCVGNGQSGNSCADHHDSLDRSGNPAGNV